jgi:subtilisin-like proprotein convertase family protein
MKKKLLLSLITFIFIANSYGQVNLWNKVSDESLAGSPKMDRASMPKKYQLYSLDLTALKSQLADAPIDSSGQTSNLILSFPNPDGVFDRYAFYESPIMEKGLEDQFPDIKTYRAIGIDDPSASMRISFTMFGLHSMTISGISSTVYIDTYTSDLNNYIVYKKSEISNSRQFQCDFNEENTYINKSNSENDLTFQRFNDSTFRTYRLAVACTGEYAGKFGGTIAGAQAAIVTTINRVNTVYERDFSIRLILIANNTSILFTNGATDPFTNSNTEVLIGESQTEITARIGSANFDIGHTVCTDDGGLAGLGVVCNNSSKARGVTGSDNPVGDPFDIDYVAHEMGHQFGCTHTFNNTCGPNRTASTAFEPGSGSTIMAYAGICSPNVQNNSDAYFSFIGLQQVQEYISGTTCAVSTASGNTPPIVDAGLNYTIPKSTAFILTGVATDVNNDALTYCWEQANNEISTQAPVSTSTVGPNFRSFSPTTSPQRYFPNITSVVANNLTPTWEVVPSVARTMDFKLSVRDNSTLGGQTAVDNMRVTTSTVGPFSVTAPNTAVSWAAGSNQTVTWSVAGTTENGINATYVDILLSNDGGFTYPVLLASKVPNDGSQVITIPNITGNTKRIMVRGYNHIFYDISNANFTITAAPSTFSVAFSGVEGQQNKTACQGTNVNYNITYLALGGFSGTTTFSASGLPSGATASFTPSSRNSNGNVEMTIGNTASSPVGFYNITVTATSGSTSKTVSFYLDLLTSVFPSMILTSPLNNTVNQQLPVLLTWQPNSNATSYDVQIATDNTFTNVVNSGNVTTTNYSATGLGLNTEYYWRVSPKNESCVGIYSNAYKFTTSSTVCNLISSTNVPISIPSDVTSTRTSTLNISTGGVISDVNVNLNLTHSWIDDLDIYITSPAGTEVLLITEKCGSNDNIVATFDDAGTALVCASSPAITGTIIPEQLLSVFNGQNANGTWTLTIIDFIEEDGGALNSWSIDVCTTLGVKENTFQDFVLYPNPNNGNFTVKFTSVTDEDVSIDVFDMRGRKIYSNEFSNNGAFDQTIDLNSVQSGVYLVSVSSGDTKIVKRIIVE